MRRDVYQNITDQIVAELEKGVRPWLKPWSADHMAARVVRPLRHNGKGYQGINVIVLWAEAMAKGYAAPIWMTFKQAIELGACVRKGERGSLVVYANKITRTETDAATNEESAHDIHYMKGYTVFNVAQIDGLAAHYYAKPAPRTSFPANFMRHYYDVYSLLQWPKIQAFIGTDAYRAHKTKRFRQADNLNIAENQAFVLSDAGIRATYERAYASTSALYYGGKPTFEQILKEIGAWADRL